jgi:hypothetical protein
VGLDQLEVGEARQAELAAEREPDRELRGQHRDEPFRAGQERDQGEAPDHRLVRARRARVDHVGVVVGVRRPARHPIRHYGW